MISIKKTSLAFFRFIFEVFDFYNMLVDDVPFVSAYAIKNSDFKEAINQIDAILQMIEIELRNFGKLDFAQFFPQVSDVK